jgi:hypothetical protein
MGNNVKSLIEKLFKKEPQFNYIIAEYQPVRIDSLRTGVNVTEYEIGEPANSDEMEIDNLYQRA